MDQSVDKIREAVPSSDPQRNKQKRKIPSPGELVSHYEAQGMDTQAASLKVIEDLQNALFKTLLSSRSNKNAPGQPSDLSRKLDVINTRLLQLETKVESKPGYPQMLAIGVASGAIVGALSSAAGEIWAAMRRATNSSK